MAFQKLIKSSFITCLTQYGVVRGVGMFRQLKMKRGDVAAGEEITLPVPRAGRSVFVRYGTADMRVFRHVMLKEDCAVRPAGVPKVIVDAGAHIGMATVFYAMRYPGAKILAIEPEGANFALLKKNTADFPNVECFQAALYDRAGAFELINPDGETWTPRLSGTAPSPPTGTGNGMAEGHVEALTIGELLRRAGAERIDILKMDIEGAERAVLADSKEWIGKVGILLVETHDRFEPGCTEALLGAIEPLRHRVERSSDKHIVYFDGSK